MMKMIKKFSVKKGIFCIIKINLEKKIRWENNEIPLVIKNEHLKYKIENSYISSSIRKNLIINLRFLTKNISTMEIEDLCFNFGCQKDGKF